MKSYDVSLPSLYETSAAPPERQLSPLHGQLTSFGASLSWQPRSLDAKRGEMTIVFSSASARNAAASAVRK